MKALRSFTLIALFGLLGNMALANCGHPHHDRAYRTTLQRMIDSRSDYYKKQMLEEFVMHNCFTTAQFTRMLAQVRSDYYRFELAKFAMQYVSNPLAFSNTVPMLRSTYYQRELQSYIYRHPRYTQHNRRHSRPKAKPHPNHQHRGRSGPPHRPSHGHGRRRC